MSIRYNDSRFAVGFVFKGQDKVVLCIANYKIALAVKKSIDSIILVSTKLCKRHSTLFMLIQGSLIPISRHYESIFAVLDLSGWVGDGGLLTS